ncbi:MAG: YggS family pyridoxal phosphate-dependent enzyme [Candidatus Dormibacteraeota bacterium]|nr:YggS family pyridoxal phosphate-dependent enzyme [Candidatus Dormibacteraeota bacterium]
MSGLTAEVVTKRLESIQARVTRAAEDAGRDPASIGVLAVTKGHAVEAVAIAVQLGLRDVGESRVQEAEAKRAAYAGAPLSWHMIGHLQRNKARAAASLFDTVHSVDSLPLAAALARHRDTDAARLRVFVEVELTGIPTRSGVTPEDAPALLTELRAMPRLEVDGLMTIAPPGPPEVVAECFARLRDLRGTLADRDGIAGLGLSMGMSSDFEVAIAHGATVIRLGRALFGAPAGPGT